MKTFVHNIVRLLLNRFFLNLLFIISVGYWLTMIPLQEAAPNGSRQEAQTSLKMIHKKNLQQGQIKSLYHVWDPTLFALPSAVGFSRELFEKNRGLIPPKNMTENQRSMKQAMATNQIPTPSITQKEIEKLAAAEIQTLSFLPPKPSLTTTLKPWLRIWKDQEEVGEPWKGWISNTVFQIKPMTDLIELQVQQNGKHPTILVTTPGKSRDLNRSMTQFFHTKWVTDEPSFLFGNWRIEINLTNKNP